jgi:hypothetical protein
MHPFLATNPLQVLSRQSSPSFVNIQFTSYLSPLLVSCSILWTIVLAWALTVELKIVLWVSFLVCFPANMLSCALCEKENGQPIDETTFNVGLAIYVAFIGMIVRQGTLNHVDPRDMIGASCEPALQAAICIAMVCAMSTITILIMIKYILFADALQCTYVMSAFVLFVGNLAIFKFCPDSVPFPPGFSEQGNFGQIMVTPFCYLVAGIVFTGANRKVARSELQQFFAPPHLADAPSSHHLSGSLSWSRTLLGPLSWIRTLLACKLCAPEGSE